jgi:hypothetical protein
MILGEFATGQGSLSVIDVFLVFGFMLTPKFNYSYGRYYTTILGQTENRQRKRVLVLI